MVRNLLGVAFGLVVAVLLVGAVPASALTINQGETVFFEFASLPDLVVFDPLNGCNTNIPCPTTGGMQVVIQMSDDLGPGEQILLQAYAHDTSETPFFSNVWDAPTGDGGFGFGGFVALDPWADMQGVFTLTALVGSMNIAYAQAREYILYPYETVYYGRTFEFSARPPPSRLPAPSLRPWAAWMAQEAEGKFVAWRLAEEQSRAHCVAAIRLRIHPAGRARVSVRCPPGRIGSSAAP